MKNRFTRYLICALLAIAWLIPAQAQEADNEGVAMLAKITPKDGHEKTLLEAIEEYHKWIANFEGHMEFKWYEVLTGPETGLYYARTGDHDWAEFDAKYDWQEKAGEVFQTNVSPHVESVEVRMTVEMRDVSHWPENWDGYTHFTVEPWYVMNGQYGKFNRGLKRIVKALKEGGFPYHFGFHRVVSGGYSNEISLVSPTKGWSGMSEEEPSFYDIMVKEMGSEEAFNDFMADWGSTFKPGQTSTVKFMPDASDYGKD